MAINPNESGSIPASTPLTGTERVDVNVGPVWVNTTTADIAALATGGGTLSVPQPHIAQLTAAPTEGDFNGLLTALQNAGILAAS